MGVGNKDIPGRGTHKQRYDIGRKQNMFGGWWVIHCDWSLRDWQGQIVEGLEQQAKKLRLKPADQEDPWRL